MQRKDKQQILQEFGTYMNTESAQSRGLFTYHGKNSSTRDYIIDEYTSEIRRQLEKFVSPWDSNNFHWQERDGQRFYDFASGDGERRRLHYKFDEHTEIMTLYIDNQNINTVQLDMATKTTRERELFAELWLLQHLKDVSKNKNLE